MKKKVYLFFKRVFDILCSLLGIVVTFPLWLVAAIGILISDPGPIFYKANRVGKDNCIFKMYKFRSMRQGIANEAVFRGDEERIFKFGKFIRNSKIDELPQLINILIGNMSIVGPRPAAVDQKSITRSGKYAVSASVVAGLTGPSAIYDYIYGDKIIEAKEYEEKVLPTRLELDCWYVEHMCIYTDIKMIFFTVVCVVAEIFKCNTPRIYRELVELVSVDKI